MRERERERERESKHSGTNIVVPLLRGTDFIGISAGLGVRTRRPTKTTSLLTQP